MLASIKPPQQLRPPPRSRRKLRRFLSALSRRVTKKRATKAKKTPNQPILPRTATRSSTRTTSLILALVSVSLTINKPSDLSCPRRFTKNCYHTRRKELLGFGNYSKTAKVRACHLLRGLCEVTNIYCLRWYFGRRHGSRQECPDLQFSRRFVQTKANRAMPYYRTYKFDRRAVGERTQQVGFWRQHQEIPRHFRRATRESTHFRY
jgi:hypothetical protein